MIEIRDLTKRFGPGGRRARQEDLALRGVTLSVPAGTTWAVAGPNGAGKSTLFALILGFLRPTDGEVEVGGLAPRRYARRHGAGFLPERFDVPADWPVRASLLGFARLDGLGRGAAARADAMIERLGLADATDRRFGALSHGTRQRLGLAQALLARRSLIVLDEPTEGLDPLWRVRLRGMLADAQREGATILIATHDLAEAERLASRVVVLDAGRVRDILDARAAALDRDYVIRLAADAPAMRDAFPDAVVRPDASGASFLVSVDGPAELSARLAAAIAGGAIIVAVEPVIEPLEERVRRTLDHP